MSAFHASANRYTTNLMNQFAANLQRVADAEEAARGLVLEASEKLAQLIGYETPAWETFWATVDEPSTNVTILGMLQAEIKRVEAEHAARERDWQDERQLYADLKRGG